MSSEELLGKPSEIINVCVGQCGIQMGNGFWELLCLEHGVTPDGKFLDNTNPLNHNKTYPGEKFDVFFYGSNMEQIVPRAITVDLEPTVVDEIRTGSYRDLFHPSSIINGLEDASNNFARGHFTVGKSIITTVLEDVRKHANRCDALQGFNFVNGLGGGTGSGFGALIIEHLNADYAKSTKMMMNVFTGNTQTTSTVDPYNTALGMHSIIEHADLNVTMDNEAVYKIVANHLRIGRPTYNDINRLMAQIASSATCSLRFPCSINCDLSQLQTNLVPFPRIHFPVSCFAPLFSRNVMHHETLDVRTMVKALFEDQNRLVSININQGRYMACNLLFRGDISPKDINTSVNEIKGSTDLEFVDWCPTIFKIGLCDQPPLCVPASGLAPLGRCCSLLANNSSIGQKWENILHRFDLLFNKRAFVHWFVGEGMEEGELVEARTDVVQLISDYSMAGKNQKEVEAATAEFEDEKAKVINKSPSKIDKNKSASNSGEKENHSEVWEQEADTAKNTEGSNAAYRHFGSENKDIMQSLLFEASHHRMDAFRDMTNHK